MKDTDRYTKIYTGNQVAVVLLKGLLEEASIPVIEKNEQKSGIMAGFVGGTTSTIKLYVLEADTEKATKIVADFVAQQQ